MAYVITEPCVDVKDASCVDVCPVDCIYPLATENWDPSPEEWWQEPLSVNDPYM